VSAGPADPASIVTSRMSMRLALIAALQYLPARQRAVLILRDVLRWRAAEVADLLGTTTIAVNRMLQRARARLEQAAPDQDRIHEPADPQDRALLDRFATAFQNADVTAVMQLLREDAVFEMPPEVTWFTGRELIGRFLQARVLTQPGRFQMIPVAANGQPALAAYIRGHDGGYRAHSICVLTIAASRVTRVTSFNDPGLFADFGLPQTVPAAAGPVPGR
jgi:RNA polymerase sigma-70 factor (ECF subfamily)